uniref:Vacuolar protein sorting-associated protein 13 VPS13 adaptor binding domain-containing protein n=1 Tax=Vitrella brassicaformis TaxID=1169539 RepID=A0A7S1NZL5_9ALVE|mmetsp:Transcript_18719/g.45044  ORF Transcript_18719/g.45044 Transcript_18719/m.45044 type:complete len:1233 (+) Transcript_18719:147-3845(+)
MKGSSRGLRNSSPSRADFHLHMTSEAHVIHYHGKRCVQWHLTLRAPIRIRSTLPIPCSYQINSHVSQKPVETSLWSSRDSAAKYRETQFTHSGSLVTNCTEHIHSLELQDRVTLQLCLFGAQFRGQVIIYHRNPAGRFTFEKVQAYRCLDVDNRVTEVEVINESPDPNAPPDILVHVPVWLVNYADPTLLSDQPLAYDLGLLSRRSPSPPSSLSINDVDPQSIWLDYDVDMVNYLTDQRVNGVAFRGRQPEPPEQDSHALVLPMDAKMERVAVSVKGNAARSPYINTRKLASDGAICVRVPDEAGKLPDARLDFGVRVVQCPVPMVREVKLLYLSFRYYLVNDLPCHLEIKQASTDAIGLSPAAENIGIVAPGSERPFFWPDYTKPLELSIRIQGSGWRWSGTIPVNRIGEWTCRLRRDTESANVRILIATSQGSCFIRLREERADLPDAIKIVNSTSLPIRVKQGPPSSRLPSDEVASGTEMFFGWHEYPSKRVVSAIPVHSDFAGLSPSEIDLTSTETKQIRLQDPGRGKPLFAYTYQVQQKGNLKYLTFSTASTNASDRKVLPSPPSVPPPERDRTFSDIEKLVTDTPPVLELSIELENVVLSLICRYPLINPLTEDHEMHNNELLLISFEGIHFLYARSHPVSGMLSDSVSWLPYEIRPAGVRQHRPQEICSFTVQDLQIDCQSSDAHFPVILYRCPPSQGSAAVLGRVLQGQLLDRTTIQSTLASRPILHLSYKRHLGFPELAYFEAFRLAITDILCRVDSRLVSDISLMLEQYKNAFEQRNQANDRETASLTAPEQSPVKQSSRVQSRPWEPPALVFSRAENVSKLYFEDLNVRPIFLLVSYSERSSLPSKSAFFLPRVARSVLTSVDSAPFWLSAFQAQHQALEVSVLVNQIKDHYYWQLTLWGASAGLLSLEFFGNPIGLVGAVLESASDLIYKPFESVAREGLFALPQGIASGVTSAFFGTLSTTGAAGASVAGTFSQTLGAMSLDDKFVHSQREDVLRNRPRTIMDTFVAAGSTGLKGIAEGLTGFVRQPAEGFSETGIEGFVTGLVKGTAGLVFKPTAASLNAVQKLFIGIQDVAATAELKQRERRRLPRVLYGSDRLLKPYNEKHAIVKSRLAYVEAQCWSYLPYQCILPDERRDCVYLITDSLLLQVDVRSSSTRFRLVELYKIESVGGRSADRNRRASFMVPFSLWAQPSDRHENPVAQATELTAFESHLSSCLDITI